MISLSLNAATWDIGLDAYGNIATITEPQRVAQDVACACKVFYGELFWNTGVGVPYLQSILGQQPTLAYVTGQLQNAALTVPGVTAATAVLTGITARQAQGSVYVTTVDGATIVVTL